MATESRLVYRLQAEHPDQLIIPLADVPPFCKTMSQITLANLSETLAALSRGEMHNEVTVDDEISALGSDRPGKDALPVARRQGPYYAYRN